MYELHKYRQKIEVTVNSTLTLKYVPDSCQRVYIKGYNETRKVEYDDKKKVIASSIKSNEYYVDYNTGKITFGSGIVGKTVTIIYYSREES